jgi:hypothetical protein
VDNVRFSQSHGIVGLVAPTADNYNAGGTWESFDMSNYNHCTIIILGSASVAGTGALTINCGLTVGATTAAVTFGYRYGGDIASAASDTYGTPASSAALTITEASMTSGVLVVEFDASDLNVAGVQYRWVTPVLDAAGTAGIVGAVAILSEPRYSAAIMPTAV